MNQQEITKIVGCSDSLVSAKCVKYGIKFEQFEILTKDFIENAILENKTCRQLAKEVGCGVQAIHRRCSQYHLSFADHFDIITKDFLKEKVKECKTLGDIAAEVGCDKQTVKARMKKFDVEYLKSPSNHYINYDYFNTWSFDMAYILGLLAADGCLNFQKCNRKNLILSLHKNDIDAVEFVRDKISPTKQIEIPTQNKKMRTFRFATGEKMANRLIELGIIPRKSGYETMPLEMPKEFKWSFICGYFDGDGSVGFRYWKKNINGITWSICSTSKIIIEQIQEFVQNFIPYANITCDNNRKTPLYRIYVYRKEFIKIIRENMYKNVSFSFKRKRDRMFYNLEK